jgi:hypothetical protein
MQAGIGKAKKAEYRDLNCKKTYLKSPDFRFCIILDIRVKFHL